MVASLAARESSSAHALSPCIEHVNEDNRTLPFPTKIEVKHRVTKVMGRSNDTRSGITARQRGAGGARIKR